jgi:hypothetical protein
MTKVKKNFLDKEIFFNIQKIVMSDMAFYFNSTVAFPNEKIKNDNFYFYHILYDKNKINSNFFNKFEPLLEKLNITSLIRMKVNLYTKTHKLYYHDAHKDYSFDHKGCVYSINTCDGGTYINDNFYKSVENQAVLFNPSKPHKSTTCTDAQARFNVNINYV